MYLLWEALIQHFHAVIKNLLQLAFHKQCMGNATQNAQRNFVVHNVFHFYAAFHRFEEVLVMPQ